MSSSPSIRRPAGTTQRLSALIVGTVLAVAALCAAVGSLAEILSSSFAQIEEAEMRQKSTQLYRALEADLGQLHVSNRDYAEWDDSVAYLDRHDPAYLSANFTAETLRNMRVDVVWIVDRQGTEVYSCYFDRAGNRVLSPAPRQYLQPLAPFASVRSLTASVDPAELIVVMPGAPAAVAAREITRTNGTGATGAVMIFARFIASAEVQRIQQTSQLPLAITYLRGPDDLVRLPTSVRAWIRSGVSAVPTLVYAPSKRSISAYRLITDVKRLPVAVIATEAERTTYALGYRTTMYLLGVIVLLSLVFGATAVWFMLRLQRSFADRYAAERRYRLIGEQLQQTIVLLEASTQRIIEANQNALAALGCTAAGLAHHGVDEVFPDISTALLQEIARASGRRVLESRARCAGDRWIDAEVTVAAAEIGGVRVLALVGQDVSHRKEAVRRERDNRRKLLRAARQDALTTLPNRAFLNARLPEVLKKMAGSDRRLALIYVDVDHFKHINDSRGHPEGDQLLQVVARRLRAAVGAQDVVARMGGDEFVIVATLLPNLGAIEQLAVRLQTVVAAPMTLGNESLTVTASLGIAVYPDHGADAAALLKCADIALYHAKNAGRNCHRFFSTEMDQVVSERASLEQALHQTLGTDQIYMEYQPIVELSTGRLVSLEALMRWNHPAQGVISPARFIPVAERSGLILELGAQALRSVLGQLRVWLDAKVPVVPVAVNVSPPQLERTDFVALVLRLAQEAGVEPQWLRFEITETAMTNDTGRIVETLAALRQLGSQVLIDDFGTGYSSLSYLNQLPVDVVKIDRTFVCHLGNDEAKRPIVSAIIDMARQLRLKTVAEGVETPDQAAALLSLGCDFGQGFLYSRPVGARACRSLLEQLRREAPLTQTVLVRALSFGKAS